MFAKFPRRSLRVVTQIARVIVILRVNLTCCPGWPLAPSLPGAPSGPYQITKKYKVNQC